MGGVALWGSSSLFLVAMTPRVDVTLIFAVLLALYALLLALRDEAPRRPLVAALIAGVAVGIKYHAIPYVAVHVPLALWAPRRENRSTMPRPGNRGIPRGADDCIAVADQGIRCCLARRSTRSSLSA